jgi:hypothetical protein
MSLAAVEKALGKLITDECFRAGCCKDPAAAGIAAGLELSQAEPDVRSRVSVEAIARFNARLDHRLWRLLLEEHLRSASPWRA